MNSTEIAVRRATNKYRNSVAWTTGVALTPEKLRHHRMDLRRRLVKKSGPARRWVAEKTMKTYPLAPLYLTYVLEGLREAGHVEVRVSPSGARAWRPA